ncbi:MAG: c-type cytochrome [Bacteriovoracaceae bacterium]|jgi:cytochrome c553|nr:c-type cytochrome [Bacteriovoracaceae bacterium]
MSRLIFFILLLVGIGIINSLKSYKDIPVTNKKFNLKQAETRYKIRVKESEDLALARQEVLHPVHKEKEVKVEAPLVVLSTPELERGHALYKKCVVCHGKRGEGKKSQNAPAIGGQHDWYLTNQLNNMKAGIRVNKKMNPYISKLSSEDFNDLASYVSKLPKTWNK